MRGSILATTPTGSIVAVVLATAGAILGVMAGGRGHRLGNRQFGELGVDLEDQVAQDEFGELEVRLDLLQDRTFGAEEGEEVGPLLVAVDRVGQATLVPLAAGDDLGIVLGEDVVDVLDGVVPVDGDLLVLSRTNIPS